MDRSKQDIQSTSNRVGRRCAAISRSAIVALVVTGLMAGTASGQLPCSYTVTVLPNAPCFDFHSPANPVAINSLGHVLLTAPQCFQPLDETYIWTGGPALTLIPRPAGMLGFTGADLNDNGVIVGQAHYASPTGPRAAIYDTNWGQWTILPPLNPPSGWSGASAISNNNKVCGYRSVGSPGDPVNPYQAFRWSAASGFEDFGNPDGRNTAAVDINTAGDVSVSSGMVAVGAFAYLWFENGTRVQIQPPLCISSEGGRLTDARLLTTGGIVQTIPFQSRGFLYGNGSYLEMPPLPGATTASYLGIAESGLACGRSNFAVSNWKACVWVNGTPIDLVSLVPSTLSATMREAWISRNGMVVTAGALANGDSKNFLLTAVTASVGDATCDGQVNVDDLLHVINTWGNCAGCRSDFDGNAMVGVSDLLEVLMHWSQ